MSDIDGLVGATMSASFTKDGNLYFVTDRGIYKGEPWGDCCAQCYVQHVSGTDALAKGAVVTSVDDIEMTTLDKEDEYSDVSDVWGHVITTTKGRCTVEMRLDHNGYYGGNLNFFVLPALPEKAHEDCVAHPELAAECGCLGKVLDDF